MKSVHVFFGVDMRSMHNGLEKLCLKHKVNLRELATNEAVVFINRAKDRVKTYSYNGVISYIKFEDSSRPFNMDAIDEIPKAFKKDGTLNYPKALKAALERKLKNRRFKEVEFI